jgi:hypothetical protein
VLDLALDDRAVWRCLFRAIQHPPRDGGDLIQIAFQRCLGGLPLLRLRFQKQLRFGKDPLARLLGSGVAPSVVQ